MLVSVTGDAGDLGSAVLAQLPVGDDVGRDFAVAFEALGVQCQFVPAKQGR